MYEENLITARKICKSFGPTRALIDVDIDIRRGEIRGLIGENGFLRLPRACRRPTAGKCI